MKKLREFWQDESGASASEYAVLVALIAAALALAISQFELNVFFGIRDKVLSCVNKGDGTC